MEPAQFEVSGIIINQINLIIARAVELPQTGEIQAPGTTTKIISFFITVSIDGIVTSRISQQSI